MSFKGLWEDSKVLFCNKCLKWINKWSETLVVETSEVTEDVFCMHCRNWLCGAKDAFGERG